MPDQLTLDAIAAARERATCSDCGARTYRQEECVCDPDDLGDRGDAEDYDEALRDEIDSRVLPQGFQHPPSSGPLAAAMRDALDIAGDQIRETLRRATR